MDDQPIQVNRAPVLTLWATVVAEALGHQPELIEKVSTGAHSCSHPDANADPPVVAEGPGAAWAAKRRAT